MRKALFFASALFMTGAQAQGEDETIANRPTPQGFAMHGAMQPIGADRPVTGALSARPVDVRQGDTVASAEHAGNAGLAGNAAAAHASAIPDDSRGDTGAPASLSPFRTLRPVGPSVFLGGVSNTRSMADRDAMADVLGSGKISLYVHPFAPNFSWGGTVTAAVTSAFNPVGTAMIELGSGVSASLTEATLENTTGAPVTLPPLTSFSDGSHAWLLVQPTLYAPVSGAHVTCVVADTEVITIPANSRCALPLRSADMGAVTVSANTLRSALHGIRMVSNYPVTSRSYRKGESGYLGSRMSPGDAAASFTGGAGDNLPRYRSLGIQPVISPVNIDNSAAADTPAETVAWNAWVDAVRTRSSIRVLAPVLQPSSWALTAARPDFASDPFMTEFRKQAVHGGGIAFDAPPSWVRNFGGGYFIYLAQMTAWARANHLEVIWIVSPMSERDMDFVANLHWMVAQLKARDALPTRWAVENYAFDSVSHPDGCAAVGTANDRTRTDVTIDCPAAHGGGQRFTYPYADSLNAAALFLAQSVGTAPAPDPYLTLATDEQDVRYCSSAMGLRDIRPQYLSSSDLSDGSSLLHTSDIGGSVVAEAPDGSARLGPLTIWGNLSFDTPTAGLLLNGMWLSGDGRHGIHVTSGGPDVLQIHPGAVEFPQQVGSMKEYGNITFTNDRAGLLLGNLWLSGSGSDRIHIVGRSGELAAFTPEDVSFAVPVQATSYREKLSTPASSSSSCAPGQFTDDANYHYVCVAPNHWKRVALSSF
jgi:hypothetical protein